jgi:hypothetical protein
MGDIIGHAGIILGERGLWVVIINKVLIRFWVLIFGRFVLGVPRSSSFVFGYFVIGVLFLILVPQASFLGVLFLDPCFWRFILVPEVVGRYAADSGWRVVASWVF